MKLRRRLPGGGLAAISCAILVGCVQPVAVAPLAVKPTSEAARIPGHFAVVVGLFPVSLSARLPDCAAYNFQADIGQIYLDAVRAAFGTAFQQVDFVRTPLLPADLAAGGYTAQFALDTTQGAARSQVLNFGFGHSFTVKLQAAVTTSYPKGVLPPVTLVGTGQGAMHEIMLVCDQLGPIVGDAAHAALADLVQQELNTARAAASPPAPIVHNRPMY